MIPENEQLYVKKCWRCEASYKSQSPFVLELCQECWTPLSDSLKAIGQAGLVILLVSIPLWLTPLWVPRVFETPPPDTGTLIVTCIFLGLLASFLWSICLLGVLAGVAAIADKIIELKKDGWFNWIPLLLGKKGK